MVRPALLLVLVSCLVSGCAAAPKTTALHEPALREPYLDLITTYCVYAKSIWHGGDVGGYWGDGINPDANQNGATRGTCNTLVGYATLVAATDQGWLSADATARLAAAGLDRKALVRYVTDDLRYVAAHHESAQPRPRQPAWGLSWQSPLWTGAMGTAALLVWDDLPKDVQAEVKQVAATEADRVAARPPPDYVPGDTKAEENGWDLHALAIALALDPKSPRADDWWRSAKLYAVNTYSVKADQGSVAKIGADVTKDIVTTANLFDDFTLENHGFFHPDYVQVSGQELGEAWLMLQLGDRLHRTNLGEQFKPYALHHAADVWDKVARPLVLPDGEFTFPAGTDWTVNCGITPSYLAYVATGLDSGAALKLAAEEVKSAQRRRAASPPGRILGDSNLEWWWESLLVKRSSTALLQYAVRGAPELRSADVFPQWLSGTWLWPDSKVWVHRASAGYFASVSWGSRKLATFTPLAYRDYDEHPYSTLPIEGGILPAGVESVGGERTVGEARVLIVNLSRNRGRCLAVCLPHSVLWLSPVPLRAIGIENDSLTKARYLAAPGMLQTVAAVTPRDPIELPGAWVNVDNAFTFVSTPDGFVYTPAGKFNRKSAAIDFLAPHGRWGAWQMLSCSQTDSVRVAKAFDAQFDGKIARVTLLDGVDGKQYRVAARLTGEVASRGELITISPAR